MKKSIYSLIVCVLVGCSAPEVLDPQHIALTACGTPDASSGHDAASDASVSDSGPGSVSDSASDSAPDVLEPVPMPSASVVYVGHSLINHRIPAMVAGLAEDAGFAHSRAEQIYNGSGLVSLYNDSAKAPSLGQDDFKAALTTGEFDTLIVTEKIPVFKEAAYWGGNCWAAKMREHLEASQVPGGKPRRMFVYEGWEDANNPTGGYPPPSPITAKWASWSSSVDADFGYWIELANKTNEANSWVLCTPNQRTGCRPSTAVKYDGTPLDDCQTSNHPEWPEATIIPVAHALRALHSAIPVAGITSMTQVFQTESYAIIHLTDLGNYLAACTVFAAVYGVSPEGLTHDLSSSIFNYAGPTAEQARVLQTIAWNQF